MTNRLFYSHSTALAAIMVFLYSLYLICSEKIEYKYIAFIVLILLSTLRFKAIGLAIASVIVLVYINKTKKKITISKFAILAVLILILSFSQISNYFINSTDTARSKLLTSSIQIANDYFPTGTGFATYGSYYSGTYYSPVYYKYNLNNVYGISPDYYSFISDNFWPMILGQYGWISVILFIYCIYLLYKNIQKTYEININLYLGKLICFIYLLIASTSESAFVHPLSIPLAFILGINCISSINEDN